MKKNLFFEAMNDIDATIIERADRKVTLKSRGRTMRIAAIAACFALLVAGLAVVLPMLIDEDEPVVWENVFDSPPQVFGAGEVEITGAIEGTGQNKYPVFVIMSEKYDQYEIENAYPIDKTDEFIDEKIDEILIMNGVGYFGEKDVYDMTIIRAEVYAVNGVSPDAGVAIKFVEEGPFNSTEHYFAAVNTLYSFTTLSDFFDDYNAPVHMGLNNEIHQNDRSWMKLYEYGKFNLQPGAANEICKILLTLDAPAEVDIVYRTSDERIADRTQVLEFWLELDSAGTKYCHLNVHDTGYITIMNSGWGVVFFNVGKEATDAIFKVFEEKSEVVSFCTINRAIGERVEITGDALKGYYPD